MLTQLNPENYEVIRGLFPKHYPHVEFIDGTVEKKIKGDVWVDEVNNPQSALVICGFYIFIAGKISKNLFAECYLIIKERIKLLEKMSTNVKTTLSLVCPQEMLESPINFAELGFVSVPRVAYGYKQNAAPAKYKNDSVYELIAIDQDNISHCLWHEFISDIVGEKNLSHHMGYMLWDEKAQCVVSEAHGIVGGDVVEVFTATNTGYVKKGFSTNVCTRLIVEATQRGLHPIWTCSKDNLPSNKIAQQHLGMDTLQEYNFYNIGP